MSLVIIKNLELKVFLFLFRSLMPFQRELKFISEVLLGRFAFLELGVMFYLNSLPTLGIINIFRYLYSVSSLPIFLCKCGDAVPISCLLSK